MFHRKGPACAGLFFALGLSVGASDVRHFLEAFTPLVIKAEKSKRNYRWGEKNRDCAGLVRYLFWESTQRHDDTFFSRYPEMSRFAEHPQPRSVKMGNTAAELIANSKPLGRTLDPQQWQTGDLLFFSSSELKIRHVMLVVRSGAQIFLVYHTGDIRDELRIRTLGDIMNLPDSLWHADSVNPVFQGVYRPYFLA